MLIRLNEKLVKGIMMKLLAVFALMSAMNLYSQTSIKMDSITCVSENEEVTLQITGDLNQMKNKFNSFKMMNYESNVTFSINNLGYSDVLGSNNDLIESAIIDFEKNGKELGMVRIEADEIRVSGVPESISESSTLVFPYSNCN